MSRRVIDPDLHELAKALGKGAFEPGLDDEERIRDADAEDLLNAGRLSGIRTMKDAKTFSVYIFTGGKQRVIGLTKRLSDACRFADMARFRFARYRARDAREPVQSDLNFDIENVKQDLLSETGANDLLDRIEQHFFSIGVWTESTDATDPAHKPERRRTVRDDVNYRFGEVCDRLDAFSKHLVAMQKELTEIKAALFKRDGFCVDKVAEPVHTFGPIVPDVNTYEADQRIVPFIVLVPDPNDTSVIHKREIQVPVRIENGAEILTPAAHEMIARCKQVESDMLKKPEQIVRELHETIARNEPYMKVVRESNPDVFSEMFNEESAKLAHLIPTPIEPTV